MADTWQAYSDSADYDARGPARIVSASGQEIVRAIIGPDGHPTLQFGSEAARRLILAAPVLEEACRDAASNIQSSIELRGGDGHGFETRALKQLTEAIDVAAGATCEAT
jgi:hypothetical protein